MCLPAPRLLFQPSSSPLTTTDSISFRRSRCSTASSQTPGACSFPAPATATVLGESPISFPLFPGELRDSGAAAIAWRRLWRGSLLASLAYGCRPDAQRSSVIFGQRARHLTVLDLTSPAKVSAGALCHTSSRKWARASGAHTTPLRAFSPTLPDLPSTAPRLAASSHQPHKAAI